MPQNVGTVSLEATLDLRKAQAAYNRFQRSLGQQNRRNNLFSGISADARDIENSLGKATNRVVAFGAAAAIFTTISRATSAFVNSIIEVDQSLAKINVNLGQSTEGLKQFGAQLFSIARQTGQTFEVTAKAAEELARQGLSAEETTKRLKDALILSRVAGFGSAEAVETLTAAINSFNQQALTSTEVVNKFAAVDTKFAVSSKDLAEAVSRVGSTAQSAGVGIDQLIGLVTSLQQTTARGGATIGNGLKTIFTRVQAAPETVSALQSIGVAVKNTDGSLRDAISVLRDYASARERVGEKERAALDRTVAGTQQINVLKALLSDLTRQYSIYSSAVTTSAGATDEAIRKNEQLNQTLASLINSTSLSIKQLFANIGDQKISGIFKDFFQQFERARAYLSGDTGDEIGKSLGEGILKGLSNVISGPALISLAVILFQAFKRVTATIASEARALLTINSAVAARVNIQKQIKDLINQATDAERAQLAVTSSLIGKKEQLLAIQARINQEELAGSALTRSFQVNGRLGIGTAVDPRIRRGNKYGIANFADPIGAAVRREKNAGIPADKIYVDSDPRVATSGNPAGLLVANKLDEPLGGYQGVNRVISQGGNPKTAGLPNFAVGARNPTTAERNAAADQIYGLFQALKGAKPLSEDFHKIGVQIQDASQKLSSVARENVLGRLAKEFTKAFIASKIVNGTTEGSSQYVTPIGGFDKSGTTDSTRGYIPQDVRPFVFSAKDRALRAAEAARLRGLRRARDNNRPSLGDNLIGRQVQYDIDNPQPLGLYNDSGAYNSAIGPSYQDYRRNRLGQAVNRGYQTRRKKLAQQELRAQRNQNRALAASFILPFAGGFIPEGQGGTARGIGFGAAQGATQGAGLGGIFGLPGLGIGAVIGALVGGLSKLSKSAEELGAEFNKAAAGRNKEEEAISRAIILQEQLNDAIKDGLDEGVIKKLQTELRETRAGVTTARGRAVLGISDPKTQSKAEAENRERNNRLNARDEVQLALRGGGPNISDLGSGRNGNLGGNEQFARSVQNAIEDGAIKGITDGQILALQKIGAGNFNIDRTLSGSFSPGELPASSEKEIADAAAAFQEASKTLAPLAALADITPDKINAQNINAVAIGILRAIVGKRQELQDQADTERKRKQAANFLPDNAFLNRPNLDVYSQAALVGRSGSLVPKGVRAQTNFDFYQELINSKAIGEDALKTDKGYIQARAGVQRNNVLEAAAAFLQSNNPSIGRLTDARGNFNGTSIERLLEFVANSGSQNSSKAGLLLKSVRQSSATATQAGINAPGYGPDFDASKSGLAPGGKYDVYTGQTANAIKLLQDTMKQADRFVVKTALQVNGTIKVQSTELSAEALKTLADELTATVGKKFEAQITYLNNEISKMQGTPNPPVPTNGRPVAATGPFE